MSVRVLHGDCRTVLPTLDAGSVQCCVTSPPYYGLRDYGVAGQIGLEPTPAEYVAEMVAVFREVRRVLANDGTVWLNIGDCYASGGGTGTQGTRGQRYDRRHTQEALLARRCFPEASIKPKDLLMIPARVALALQADGWWLRSDIIWHKPNPMPESCQDRPTSAHEHVFLLSKNAKYFYDADAIREVGAEPRPFHENTRGDGSDSIERGRASRQATGPSGFGATGMRNARNVWTIATSPSSLAHFAMMPAELAERCIKAGSRPGDTILDPFGGAGTTALVADRLGRSAVIIELNPANVGLARDRVVGDAPLFAEVT